LSPFSTIFTVFLHIFDVVMHNLDTITGQDITNPTIFIKFDINFVPYNLCLPYGIPYYKHKLHCITLRYKVLYRWLHGGLFRSNL